MPFLVKNPCLLKVQNIEKASFILFCHIIANHRANEEASLVFSNTHHVNFIKYTAQASLYVKYFK